MLGGRTKKTHIELHDVRWVVGNNIKDTFAQLRQEWFGDNNGLHIDSYMKITFIDGYKIQINKKSSIEKKKESSISYKIVNNKFLWFINIGGYKSTQLAELHEFGLVVASTSSEATSKAKEKWLKSAELKHKDDLTSLKEIKSIDSCHLINSINKWEVQLIHDKYNRSQLFIPDWYGYMRIDKS